MGTRPLFSIFSLQARMRACMVWNGLGWTGFLIASRRAASPSAHCATGMMFFVHFFSCRPSPGGWRARA